MSGTGPISKEGALVFVPPVAMPSDLGFGQSFALARTSVVLSMVVQAEENKVIDGIIGRLAVQMRYLSLLLSVMLAQTCAKAAPARAEFEDLGFHCLGDRWSLRHT
jgi:hypothetical protein